MTQPQSRGWCSRFQPPLSTPRSGALADRCGRTPAARSATLDRRDRRGTAIETPAHRFRGEERRRGHPAASPRSTARQLEIHVSARGVRNRLRRRRIGSPGREPAQAATRSGDRVYVLRRRRGVPGRTPCDAVRSRRTRCSAPSGTRTSRSSVPWATRPRPAPVGRWARWWARWWAPRTQDAHATDRRDASAPDAAERRTARRSIDGAPRHRGQDAPTASAAKNVDAVTRPRRRGALRHNSRSTCRRDGRSTCETPPKPDPGLGSSVSVRSYSIFCDRRLTLP